MAAARFGGGPMGRRQAWLVWPACLLFAGLSLVSGLDRQAALRPALAERLPKVLAVQSLATLGQAEIVSGHYDAAKTAGLALIVRAPMDPAGPALLGAAQVGLAEAIAGERAFLVAGRMGWRVPMTQLYWMRRAIDVGDFSVASLRLDALLRQYPWMMTDSDVMLPIEGVEAGRHMLARRLAGSPVWAISYTNDISGLPLAMVENRAQVLTDLAAFGRPVGCDRAAPVVSRLSEASYLGEAQALWRSHCPEAGGGLLGDRDLTHLRVAGARTYFEWDLVGSSEVGMVVVPGHMPQAQAIEMRNDSSFTRVLLRQMILAPPGRYSLSWQDGAGPDRTMPQVAAAMGCTLNQVEPLPAKADSQGRWHADVILRQDCPAHWLAFMIRPGVQAARLEAIRFEPVS